MLRTLLHLGFLLPLTVVAPAAEPPGRPETPQVKPHLVTLKSENNTLDQVLDDVQKQTDVAVDRSRADVARPVKVNCDKATIWEALERIAKAADHRIAFTEQGRKVVLLGGEGASYRELPVSFDGVFRVAARKVTATYDLESDRSLYDLSLDLHWEPQFYAFLVEPPAKNVTARDNTDKDLPVAAGGRGRLSVSGGGVALTVRLTDVPRSTRTIKKIEGGFTVVGAVRMLSFAFAKFDDQEQSATRDGVTVKVRNDFKAGGPLWTAKVAFEYPPEGPQLESFEASAWLAENDAVLESADGKRRLEVNGGTEVVSQSERRAEVNYRWVPPGNATDLGKPADWKLVVRTPSRLVEVPVKFKLENIPLP